MLDLEGYGPLAALQDLLHRQCMFVSTTQLIARADIIVARHGT